jgi:methyl-accepting chemotaxis protein
VSKYRPIPGARGAGSPSSARRSRGLNRLSVGQRLAAGFLIVVLSMVAVTALGVSRVEQVSDRLTVINDLDSVKQRYAINFRGSVHDRAIALRDVVLAGSPRRRSPRST